LQLSRTRTVFGRILGDDLKRTQDFVDLIEGVRSPGSKDEVFPELFLLGKELSEALD
jgi:hypothetical protein